MLQSWGCAQICGGGCGTLQNTRQSECTILEVLRPFSGNFPIMHLGCAASEARHLIFRRYIISECHDVISDIMVMHVHLSRDLLL